MDLKGLGVELESALEFASLQLCKAVELTRRPSTASGRQALKQAVEWATIVSALVDVRESAQSS